MIDWPRRRRLVLDLFVLSNIAFLAVDTYVAHSVNSFAHPLEWVPFGFSLLATLLFVVAITSCFNVERRWGRWLGLGIGVAAIIVGIGGSLGAYLGGVIGDRLGARDARWYMFLSAIVSVVGVRGTLLRKHFL